MKINSVLITGVAGDIGRGMSKVLKDIPWIKNIYGMDINDQFPSEQFCDEFFKAPKIDDVNYIEFVEELVVKYGIELIIPASEYEIRFLNKELISEINGIPILIPSFEIMNLGFDKLKTAQFLKENNYPYPWTVLVKEENPLEIPCIVKSRNGSGSKDINIISEENLDFYQKHSGDWIFQELLLPDEKEYTAGVFKSKKGEIKTISFRRILHGGRTGYAEVVKDTQIDQFLLNVARSIKFDGSINVQFRVTENGPVIFEINPRFSSTLVFRHKLGFKDVEWSILDKFGMLDEIVFNDTDIINKKIFRSDIEIIY